MRRATAAVVLALLVALSGCQFGGPSTPTSAAPTTTTNAPPTATTTTTAATSTTTTTDATPATTPATTTATPTRTATPATTTETETPRDPDDPGTSSYRVNGSVTVRSGAVESLIHREINRIRPEHGAGALSSGTTVASVARAHSEDLADRGYFSHTNPDGEGPWDRYRDVDGAPACMSYGENIAMNWVDRRIQTGDGTVERYRTNEAVAEAVVDQWMGSSGHRQNIFRAGWTHEGIGVYLTGDGQVYATQNFCSR